MEGLKGIIMAGLILAIAAVVVPTVIVGINYYWLYLGVVK